MPKVTAAHRRAVETRLLDAADRCLARDGAAAVTTRAVVAEAGLSTGTLYHHFPTVEHLLAALAERDLRAGIAAAATAATAPGEGPLAWTLHHLVGDVALATRMAAVRRRIGPDAGARLDAMVRATLAEVVRQAGVEGEVPAAVDADALVALLAIVWDGVGRAPEDAERVTATLARLATGW